MKNLLLIAAGAAGALLVWNFLQMQKQSAALLPLPKKEVDVIEKLPDPGNVIDKLSGTSDTAKSVHTYDASPRATFPTPARLMVSASEWEAMSSKKDRIWLVLKSMFSLSVT